MKKNLRHLWLLLVGVLITFSAQQARASHAIGGDMSYVNAGPGIYVVYYRFYRDCSGIAAPSSFTLTYEATGCGVGDSNVIAGRTVTMNPTGSQVGNPYCGRQNRASICDTARGVPSNGFPNYNIYSYQASVYLGTNASSQCTDWVLSTSEIARPDTRNLGGGNTLYTEVHLNTKLVNNDSSPVFPSSAGFQPLIFTCDTTTYIRTSQVVDPDNLLAGAANTDSLVYSLKQPLSGAGVPIAYVNGFSERRPVRVWTGRPLVGQGPNLPFTVDSITGTISFTSGLYVAGSTNDTDNKFAVSIQVDSYRKINGRRQKIGSVLRDIIVVIFRCPTRSQAPVTYNNGGDSAVTNIGVDDTVYVRATDTLTVDACTNAIIDLQLNDFNGDSLKVFISNNQLPGQASISILSQRVVIPNRQTDATARLRWVPDATTIGGYYPVTLRIEDNGCPLASVTEQPLILHVVKNQYSDVGLAGTIVPDTLCRGDSTLLSATTRRPATLGEPPLPGQYRYQWENATTGDTLVGANPNPDYYAKPDTTTNFLVRVISPQGCEDTATVRVIVTAMADTLPLIEKVTYLPGTDLTYGQPYSFDPTYNGRSVPNLFAANDPNGNRFRYRIRGEEGLGAFSDTLSATPTVRNLDRTASFRLLQFSTQNCVTVRRFTIEVPLIVYNIITPNGDGKNDFFTVIGTLEPEVKIFNRWGTKVEEWANYDNKWNGGDLSPGTYFYYVHDKISGKNYKGWFEIVR